MTTPKRKVKEVGLEDVVKGVNGGVTGVDVGRCLHQSRETTGTQHLLYFEFEESDFLSPRASTYM